MGCFSFICQECGQPILSNSYRGQKVKLFLLKNSVVLESMEGEYDSYGRVFSNNLDKSIKWSMPWDQVCDLMFDKNKRNGIAAIHSKCFKNLIPQFRSDHDPNQGWGEDSELWDNFD